VQVVAVGRATAELVTPHVISPRGDQRTSEYILDDTLRKADAADAIVERISGMTIFIVPAATNSAKTSGSASTTMRHRPADRPALTRQTLA
jgi:hypothetical protein